MCTGPEPHDETAPSLSHNPPTQPDEGYGMREMRNQDAHPYSCVCSGRADEALAHASITIMDNGDLARYVYSIVPNPEAIPTTLWRFDPSGLPLAHPMISDFDPGLPFIRCSAY